MMAMIFFAAGVNAQTAKKPVPKKAATAKAVKTTRATTIRTQNKKDNSIKVKITTDMGVMVVKLYDSTPLHRDNFAKLVSEHFYDSLLFHRVIENFMIQGGDPTSKNAEPGVMLGNGGGNMDRIPAEFRASYFHKKGALAAARDNNPEKASSACQFYIVQGKKYTDDELNQMELGMNRKFTAAEREAYKTVGGTPFLDQNYTVFGQVISGMEVIDKIAAVQKGGADRPVQDVHMSMELVK